MCTSSTRVHEWLWPPAAETNEANGYLERGADLGVHHVGQLEFRAGAVAHRFEEAPGSAMRHSARLRTTTFFLSEVRYSACAGLE